MNWRRWIFWLRTKAGVWLLAGWAVAGAMPGRAAILWSDLGATLVHASDTGSDILGGALKRDDTSGDRLYFKFHVDPLSDASTEEYFAAFQLYEGDTERLGVGNSLKAWAYSAFNTAETGSSNRVAGDFDLRSSRPESSSPGVFMPYELPRRGIERTIVLKVQYVPGGDDRVTVWLNPDLAPGATEASQPENLTTTFKADASFNQIRLRHGGGGGGWSFSDMAIATSFNDFVSAGSSEPGQATADIGGGALPFTFRLWQREQGLPENSVRALTQTRDGYLWLGSDEGLARFDGVRFVSFGLREGVPGGPVRTLFEDSRGALWIGTSAGGLTRWQEGKFTTSTQRDGLPADSVTALTEDSEGRVWVGTESGLVVWQNGRLRPLSAGTAFRDRPITALFKDRQGIVWLGATGAGVFRFHDGQFTRLTDASVEGLLEDPHSLLVDQAGRLWLGAGDDFVLCREGDQWRRYRIPRHLAKPYVSTLAEGPDGTVWAGSVSEGLFQFKAGKLTAINAGSGLSDNSVASLLVDREGNLWVGTAAGLNRVRRINLSVFGQAEGLGYGPVQGLAEVAPGVIWAGKPSDGLYRWGGRNFSRLTEGDLSRRYPEINTLLLAGEGTCWVGGAHGLLHFQDPKTAGGETEVAALAGLHVISLAEDHEGGLWAGTREGELWRWGGGNWVAQTNYSPRCPITAIAVDPDGAVWIGTEGAGLYRFRKDGRTHFAQGGRLSSRLIRSLYLDAEGVLWIGTGGGGLSRWRDNRITTFTTREGLPDNTISQILEDDAGRLWLGSNRGIACVSKRELDDLAAGRIPVVYPQVYGRAEGMPSEECTGGFCPSGLKTKTGRLCFSTMKGIVVVDPRPQVANLPPPAVMLEEVLVDGVAVSGTTLVAAGGEGTQAGPEADGNDSVSLSPSAEGQSAVASAPRGPLRIAPGKRQFEFHYTGLSFSAPEQVRFRYRLEPLDAKWMEAGTRRTAFYGYLPPGNYQFHVIACNGAGVWNQTGASLALTVLPHFWQAWWFIGLGMLGLVVSVGGGVRIVEKGKLRRHVKRLEDERAVERERARIAQDLHDDLGSSLTRISLLSDLIKADKDRPGQVETHAHKIGQSADQTVRALEEIVWAVRPGSDSLQGLVEYIAHFASELFEGDQARCRLDLPNDLPARSLPPDLRHNAFLIVKEALTNALKHASAREVSVEVKATARSLEIGVQDNGQGFDPQAQAPPVPGKRHGLGNMRHRAEVIGATLAIESTRAKGTAVRLKVPFPT